MQGIHTCIPETNYVPRDYSVAAILMLLFIIIIFIIVIIITIITNTTTVNITIMY